MAWQGKVENIILTKDQNEDAVDIVNTLAAEDDRSAANTAERLIIEAGKARAEEIKTQG